MISFITPFDEDDREVFFRVEGVVYDFSVHLYLFKYHVFKKTPCGVVLDTKFSGRQETKFVNLSWRKRFAVPTIAEAIESFKKRKESQLRKLKRQIEDTENYLKVVDSCEFPNGEDTYIQRIPSILYEWRSK